MKDIAVIGGGAAGLFFAVAVKRIKPDVSVVLYEARDRVGKKIAVTGNGRCNISNAAALPANYHGDRELAAKCLDTFGYERQKAFFESLGVPFKLEGEKAFPRSLQAASVVDALRFAAEESGVELRVGLAVETVKRDGEIFICNTEEGSERFRSVVVATGGKAGGKLGNESGYDILRSLGHKIEPVYPGIVQLKTDNAVVRQLKGIKVDAVVKMSSSLGNRSEFGEVLFCDYGLSGPPILQVSRLAIGEHPIVTLDLVPDYDKEVLGSMLFEKVKRYPDRPISELFTGFLHKRIGQVVTKLCGFPLDGVFSDLCEKDIMVITDHLKCMRFKVQGTTGFENAQVTVGGASTAQFFDNLMSKKAKGLFAVGEVLNVDGDCGGYNLAFAWSSAYVAANAAVSYLSDKK
ncbi:MAG: aminoacetone oxidase family FAD-binding enzyme [Ruminococcaceae bacterium]|nr:aminoacetone oxidase family FAD-binding enzyme [Oscillospiraceae bacterium]